MPGPQGQGPYLYRMKGLPITFLLLFLMGSAAASAQPEEAATTAALADIRTLYRQTNDRVAAGVLDTIEYPFACAEDPIRGTYTFYFAGSELLLAEYRWDDGSHGGESEQYYFAGGRLRFYFRDRSYWSFGGPSVPDDGVLHTVDYGEQERIYYHEGRPFRRLTKSYRIRSWAEDPAADEVPNRVDDPSLASPATRQASDILEVLARGGARGC